MIITNELKRDGTDHCAIYGKNLNQKETLMPYILNKKICCKKCYFEIHEQYKAGKIKL